MIKRKYLLKVFLITCIFLCVSTLLYIPSMYVENNIIKNTDKTYKINDNWKIYCGDKLISENVTLPYKLKYNNKNYTLVNKLPDNLNFESPPIIRVKSKYISSEIYVDNKKIYELKPALFNKSKGTFYATQILPSDFSGKDIFINVNLLSNKSEFEVYAPIIGSNISIFTYVLRSEGLSIFLNIVMLCLSMVLLFIYFILRKISKWCKEFWVFSLLLFIYSIYYSVRSELLTFFVQNTFLLYAINYLVFSLLPVITLRIGEIFCDKKFKAIFKILEIIGFINAVCQLLVGTFTKYEFSEIGTISFILKNISLITIAIAIVFTDSKKNFQKNGFIISIIPLIAGNIIGVYLHYSKYAIDEVNVEKTCIILFVIIEIYFMIKEHFKFYKDAIDKSLFEELAYVDFMTKLKNRTAFEKDINEFNFSDSSFFIAIDANCLKKVNDSMGHSCGDKMLIKISNILKDCCYNHDVYRIGGDEFIIIVLNSNKNEVLSMISKMKQEAKKCNCEFPVSFACGYARYNFSASETLKEADKMMYIDKIKYKNNFENI